MSFYINLRSKKPPDDAIASSQNPLIFCHRRKKKIRLA